MVNFLIHRPIAVFTTYFAIMILGIIAWFQLPVSLMPDVDIPEITVHLSYPNSNAKELENAIVKPVRNQLMQVAHLRDIKSETLDGQAVIHLSFNYGTDITLAYIEVNEKLDGAINFLPKDMERPSVIKASATDIPVFYLSLYPKSGNYNNKKFIELSRFTEEVIKRQIEQLPEIALADITGLAHPQLTIIPDKEKMLSLNIDNDIIEQTLQQNNIELGNLLVKDGHYQYNIKFNTLLRTPEDVENIYFNINNRVLQLKDFAEVKIDEQELKGMFMADNQRAVSMRIIKQANARMEDLKTSMNRLMKHLKQNYPDLEFVINRDQTNLLKFSIQNLKQTLYLGAFLAFFILFFFLKNSKAPFIIGITIPVSLIVSILFFYLFHLSINIISLSGMILGIGMMIDNSIIVIDNINQYFKNKNNVSFACNTGTNEVIRPLLSSVLTTVAVFIPLIFLSGIAGALFYDQALAVAIGLFSSLIVSITLLPVVYRQLYLRPEHAGINRFLEKVNPFDLEKWYTKTVDIFFKYKKTALILCLFLVISSFTGLYFTKTQRLPDISSHELILQIDWNENISINENKKRILELSNNFKDYFSHYQSEIGEQQLLLDQRNTMDFSECMIYFECSNSETLQQFTHKVKSFLSKNYALAKVEYNEPENIFSRIFADNSAPFEIRLKSSLNNQVPEPHIVQSFIDSLKLNGINPINDALPLRSNKYIKINKQKLLLYHINYNTLYSELRSMFNQNQINILRSNNDFIPIVIKNKKNTFTETIDKAKVRNKNGENIPIKNVIEIHNNNDYRTLHASNEGLYIPIGINCKKNDIESIKQTINKIKPKNISINYTGSLLNTELLFSEMLIVLLISVLLLYFILAAQFESFLQPFIVLIELPLDIFGALLMLWLYGASLNLMSAIGIIVMSGIIINDSILKIDTINKAAKEQSLMDAIHIGGIRRIKSIVMTSLTTVLALFPFMFASGLGAELQLPFALAVIGGMTLGTIISLFMIPIFYYVIYRGKI